MQSQAPPVEHLGASLLCTHRHGAVFSLRLPSSSREWWPRSPVQGSGSRCTSSPWALAAGATALVVGHELDLPWLFMFGGTTVVLAMLGLAAILVRVRRRAVTARYAPAIEAYVAAVALGSVAMPVGILIGTGHLAARAASLRDVHLLLNVFGLVGVVVAAPPAQGQFIYRVV